jgi:inosine-uridine nucleoside N-ribohydrolase
MESEELVYVVAIGALTNVSSDLVSHPELAEKIAVIWLGGHARWFGGPEFNLQGDVNAANAVFKSGVPVLQFPCTGVVSHLIMEIHELEHFLRGNSPLGDYLCDNVAECKPNGAVSWSRVIWDISTIAGIIDPGTYAASIQPRPYVVGDRDRYCAYEFDKYEGTIEHVDHINRDRIISLLINRLRKN